jgi:hypothetical protein
VCDDVRLTVGADVDGRVAGSVQRYGPRKPRLKPNTGSTPVTPVG